MAKSADKTVEVSAHEHARLAKVMRAPSTPQRVAKRCQIVWLATQGMSERAIADKVGVARRTVVLWKRRYTDGGVDALLTDRPRSGRPAKRAE